MKIIQDNDCQKVQAGLKVRSSTGEVYVMNNADLLSAGAWATVGAALFPVFIIVDILTGDF